MKLVLDTCVLVPTALRQMLLTAAKAEFFQPVWSEYILSEWRHVASKAGPLEVLATDTAITQMQLAFPLAHQPQPQHVAQFWLPDANDIPIYALAVKCSADGIITRNAKDFPKHILAEEGLDRFDPDVMMCGFAGADPARLFAAIEPLVTQIEADFPDLTPRSIFRKAGLDQLGSHYAKRG